MKNSNFENFSSLLHTDWHPEKGDFIKDNSLNDSAQLRKKIQKHNILVGSLVAVIFVVLIGAVILFSI
jgi:uncharacterized membrane protein YvbJ